MFVAEPRQKERTGVLDQVGAVHGRCVAGNSVTLQPDVF
jgi:hypothetical protein